MLWLVPVSIIACIASFFLGYHFRGLTSRVAQLEETIKQKIDKPVEIEEPQSEIIDPDDPIQEAIYERDQLMRKINSK